MANTGGRDKLQSPPGKVADPTGDAIPPAKLKKAKSGSATASTSALPPSGLGSDGGTRGMMLAGSHPAAVVLNGMATIEQQIAAMSKYIPQITQIAAPFIDDMKSATAAGLADLVSGGMGNANLGPGAGIGGVVPQAPGPAAPPAGMPMGAPPPPQMSM